MGRNYLSRKQKIEILERQGMKCRCGRVITLEANRLRDWKRILGHYPDSSVPSRARFHRLIPGCQGGTYILSNVVGLCGDCHARVHNYYKRTDW